MSLLSNVLRSVFAGQPQAPSAAAEPDAQDAGRSGGEQPAWRLLGAQTGVQSAEYGDIARPGLKQLFGHPPRRILDVGCASGAVGADLKQSIPGLWVWGCELNEETARVAAGRLDHVTSVPRPQWSNADKALVKTIDTVLLLDVLEHMYNPWAELKFLAAQLPPEAQLIVSLPNVGHHSVLADLALGRFPYRPAGILDVTHVRFFTMESMVELFDETGFDVEDTWILSRSPEPAPERFPARLAKGKLTLEVESREEWDRLHAIQFGFRLRPAGRETL